MIVAAGLAAYANSLDGPFIFDDLRCIRDNPDFRGTGPAWGTAFSMFALRPVAGLTLAANYAIGGLDTRGYHVFNIAVHLLAGLALFGLIRRSLLSERLGGRFSGVAGGMALAAALLWTVHPLQTQAVTYVVQRRESLMGLFYLLTLYAALRGAACPHPKRWYLAAVIACFLGMGTKQTMVTAPLVVFLYDRTFLAGSFREALRQRWRLYAALAASWLVLVPYIVVTQKWLAWDAAAPGPLGQAVLTPWEYASTQFGVMVHYLAISAWPTSLCLDYGWPAAAGAGEIVVPAILIAALLALTAWALVKRPAAGFIGAAFFLILAPTSSVIPTHDPAFEHRMYLPLAAVVALAVVGMYLIGRRTLARLVASERARTVVGWSLAAALVAGAASALGYETACRNDDYRSEISIWQDTARKRPGNARAQENIGMAFLKAGDADRALEGLTIALQLGCTKPESFFNRGTAYQKKGDLDRAAADYTEAIRLKPDYAQACTNRGAVWLAKGRKEQALADLTKAVQLQPDLADAWYNRGNALLAAGDPEGAFRDFSRAIDLAPRMAEAWNNRGVVLMECGRFGEALPDFSQAVALAPGFGPAYRNRAVCHLAARAIDKAWADVEMCRKLGYAVDAAILKELSAAGPE